MDSNLNSSNPVSFFPSPRSKPNILVIRATNPFWSSSASNNRFLSLAEGLVENGARVDLLILQGYSNRLEKSLFSKAGTKDGINYVYLLPYNTSKSLVGKIVNKFVFKNPHFLLKGIKQFIGQKKYDYLWLHVGELIIKIGLKLMCIKNDVKFLHEQSEFSWIGLSPDKKIFNQYLKEFLPQLDMLVVMTKTLENYYKEYIGEKTKIIHLPMTVDFSRFNKPIADNKLNKPYIAYCGFMSNAKDGVDILLQAFMKIMNRFPELHLYLAGPMLPEHDYLKQRSIISKYSANKRVTYLGNLSRGEVPSFLLHASILALARPESKQAMGGFPTKLGEYLAAGKPVCVTNVGEVGNYLKDNESAFIARPGSIDSFSEALVKALTSDKADVVGTTGKKVALKYFNKDIQAKTFYDFLQQNM